MVEEAADALAAKLLVLTGMQDELVPEHIDRLGRHGDHAPSGLATQLEILAQAEQGLGGLLFAEVRIVLGQLAPQALGKGVAFDKSFAGAHATVAQKQTSWDQGKTEKQQ
jgi:hypothetical protein